MGWVRVFCDRHACDSRIARKKVKCSCNFMPTVGRVLRFLCAGSPGLSRCLSIRQSDPLQFPAASEIPLFARPIHLVRRSLASRLCAAWSENRRTPPRQTLQWRGRSEECTAAGLGSLRHKLSALERLCWAPYHAFAVLYRQIIPWPFGHDGVVRARVQKSKNMLILAPTETQPGQQCQQMRCDGGATGRTNA